MSKENPEWPDVIGNEGGGERPLEEGRTRVYFDFSKDSLAALDDLVIGLQYKSRAALLRDALAHFHHAAVLIGTSK